MATNKLCYLPAHEAGGEGMIKGDLWHEIHSRRKLGGTKKSIARAVVSRVI